MPGSMPTKKVNCLKDPWFWVLLALAAIIRLLFLSSGRPPFAYPDTYSYTNMALALVQAGNFGPRVWLTPGYPLVLAAFEWLPSVGLRWGAVSLQHFLGWLSVGLVYAIGVRFFYSLPRARFWAFLSGILYLNARFVLYDHAILADSIFTSLVVFQSYLFIRYLDSDKISWLAVLGLFFGISTLVKPIDQLAWTAPAIALLVWKRPLKRPALGMGLMILIFISVASLWVGRNYFGHGYFGLSAYGGFQKLIRSASLMDREKFTLQLENEKKLTNITLPPNENTREDLQGIAQDFNRDPNVQNQEYHRLLNILLGASLANYLDQTKGYRSRSVYYTFRDFYKVGFPELEIVGEMGTLSQHIMANPEKPQWKLYILESLQKHLPEMMYHGKSSNIATSNLKKLKKYDRNQRKKGQGNLALSTIATISPYLYWPNIFKILVPLSLLGLIGALILKFFLPFSSYALLRILYYPAVVIVFGNGFERYRLPADHLIILGAVLALAGIFMGVRRVYEWVNS